MTWLFTTIQETKLRGPNLMILKSVSAGNDTEGPQVLRMDGGRLIDPFEDEFYLDLPIKMKWDIIGVGTGTQIPQLRIKDDGQTGLQL